MERVEGWDRPWTSWNTSFLIGWWIQGRGQPLLTSQRRVEPPSPYRMCSQMREEGVEQLGGASESDTWHLAFRL